ncbi:hypothetical protein POM88_046312 [Heracleum sosnowskyi]|uniref:Uncharacterized protein n=1 Tax=Heracleum sosnowskyi TaxID=360622 RepID=A0AAD8H8A5_9APIA|nr:hypothetical protein POM88_046312 [Heracleum sosnowskyi]
MFQDIIVDKTESPIVPIFYGSVTGEGHESSWKGKVNIVYKMKAVDFTTPIKTIGTVDGNVCSSKSGIVVIRLFKSEQHLKTSDDLDSDDETSTSDVHMGTSTTDATNLVAAQRHFQQLQHIKIP